MVVRMWAIVWQITRMHSGALRLCRGRECVCVYVCAYRSMVVCVEAGSVCVLCLLVPIFFTHLQRSRAPDSDHTVRDATE